MARIITVASGKGGVGKSNVSVNLALELSRNNKVALFDVDLGLANINILLGIYPDYTLGHVLAGEKSIKDIIIKNYQGLDIIPGSSGVEQLANLDTNQISRLIKIFREFNDYDYIIFDTSAGIARDVISFCLASSDVILVITGEPTSLTDAFALVKVLSVNNCTNSIKVVVNQCRNAGRANMIYRKFRDVVKKYLSMEVQPLGTLLYDPHVLEAVTRQEPFIRIFPNCIASRCIRHMAGRLNDPLSRPHDLSSFDTFFMHFLLYFKGELKIPDRKTGFKKSVKSESRKVTHTVRDEETRTIYPSNEVAGILSTIAEGIASISENIKVIRKCVEAREGSGSGRPLVKKRRKTDPVMIPLDFEAFKGKR